jgi:hypothetical protein
LKLAWDAAWKRWEARDPAGAKAAVEAREKARSDAFRAEGRAKHKRERGSSGG